MKDIKEKIKKLIASGEDPELVRKLQEVLGEPEASTDEPPEAEPEFVPSEVPLAPELFSEIRKLQEEKIKIQHALGAHYSNFHKQADGLVKRMAEIADEFMQSRQKIIEDNAPEGLSAEYGISETTDSDGNRAFVLKRTEPPSEPEE